MHINIPQTFSHQAIVFDKLHYFFMLSPDCSGKLLQKRDNLRPVPEITTRQFADNTGMAHHPGPMQQGFQSIGPFNRAFKAQTGMTPTAWRKLADSRSAEADSGNRPAP